MAYCRWSTNRFMCDVYVYESESGWMTHVAGIRGWIKAPPAWDWPILKRFRKHGPRICVILAPLRRAWHRIHEFTHHKIGLEFDGQSFTHENPGACADNLEVLKQAGYNVPQYVIDDLWEEYEEAECSKPR